MVAHSPGLPLTQGLRAIGGVQHLTGWKVAAKKGHKQHIALGTVQQVDSIQAAGVRGPAYQLLRVVQQAELRPYGFKGQEVHLLPLVPDIITALHPEQQLLLVDPPEGLLDMGRRDLVLSFLAQALLPYAPLSQGRHPAAAAGLAAAGARSLTQARDMPSRAVLLSAGRADLVNLVMKVGGFTQAALQLGMRAARRPAGYWSSLEVLDMELDAFIAGCWVALPCPEDDEEDSNEQQQQLLPPSEQQQQQDVYYYNTATRSISWSLPDELQALLAPPRLNQSALSAGTHHTQDPPAAAAAAAAAAAGETAAAGVLSPGAYQALLELQEERVMPPLAAITAAGRWDLHNAITRNGGYTAVAAELERRLSKALPEELSTPEGLRAALKELCWQEGWACERLPTAQQLREADRTDLVRAITQLGGWHAAAEALNLAHTRPTSAAWHSWTLPDLAQELSMFMAQHGAMNQSTNTVSSTTSAAAAAATGGRGPTVKGGMPAAPAPDSHAGTARGGRQRLSRIISRRQQHTGDSASPPAGITPTAAQQVKPRQQERQDMSPPQHPEQQRQQQQQGSTDAFLAYLPTQAVLLAAGRLDLVYGLRQHGYEAVRSYMALPARYSRPKQKGVLLWADVESAVAAGCHSCKEILQYISTRQQHQQLSAAQPQDAHAHIQDSSSSARGPTGEARGSSSLGIVPLVSREHLQRQLRAWVNEGRLVKAARNCFTLPEQHL